MGCGTSLPKGHLNIGNDRSPGILPDEVNRLLDRWTIGHVLIIRKRFLESKPSKSQEIDFVGFRAMFTDLDQTLPLRSVSAAFRQFDTRGAGSLSFKDICVGLAASCLSSWEIRAKFLFSWFDVDKDGLLSRLEFEQLLICLVAGVRRSVECGDWSARFPFMSPSGSKEGFSMAIEARGLSPSQPETVERVQSCVTAVQSEVFSAIEEDRRSVVYDHSVEFTPSTSEREWITSEIEGVWSGNFSLKDFTEWSIRNSHYLYKLLELFEIVPSPAREKRTCVSILRRSSLEPSTSWHVVSYKWIQLWRSYVRWTDSDSIGTVWNMISAQGPGSPIASLPFDIQQTLSSADIISCTSSVLQQRLGERPPAMNNSDLEGELKGALRANLVEHHDYVLVPEEMYKLLHDWYGGGPSFPRKVRHVPLRKMSSMSLRGIENSGVELYPPLIIVLVCSERGVPVKHFTKRFFVSRSDTCSDLIDQLAKRLLKTNTECRLWHRRNGEEWELLESDDPRRIEDFVDSISTDAGAFMLESRNPQTKKFPRDDYTAGGGPQDEDGELQVGDRVEAKNLNGTGWRSATVVDITENNVKVHFDGEKYREDAWLAFTEIIPPRQSKSRGERLGVLKFFSSPSKTSPPPVRPPQRPSGLENIGNTCFMNSVLQCLSCTPLLRSFFVQGPKRGSLAGEFALLLNEMLQSRKRSVAPKNFKKALDKYAPRFAGYEHQDAHELLAVLLDGLHEDLNQPLKKQTVGTANGAPSDNVEAWKRHRAEHASIISDLFDGQQRVSTVCKECGYESCMYEAFRYIMLPVPVTDGHRTVTVSMYLGAGRKIFQLSVSVHKGSMFQHVLTGLEKKYKSESWAPTDWESTIVAAEVYLARIHRFIDPSTPISDFRSEDKIFLFATSAVVAREDSSAIVEGTRIGEAIIGSPRLGVPEANHHHQVFAQIVHRREVVVRKQRRTVTRKELFGTPFIVSVNPSWTYGQLHNTVRLHATQFGENFSLRITAPDATTCAACGKLSCEGCLVLPNSSKRIVVNGNWIFLAIDWENNSYKELPTEFVSVQEMRPQTLVSKTTMAGGGVSLYECMDAYTAREQMIGDNQWMCDECKRKVDAERGTSWWLAPDVLVVLLKRFQYTVAGFEKIQVPIEFPLSDLVLKTGGDAHNQNKYDLYGVVNHTGSLSSGHYTAVCLDETTQQWNIFNDHRVYPITDIKRELADCARSCYVLFYKRNGSRTANLINYAPLVSHTE
jgi:ubiquitin C-terminal hydrolase